jgi:hypothetical protein
VPTDAQSGKGYRLNSGRKAALKQEAARRMRAKGNQVKAQAKAKAEA